MDWAGRLNRGWEVGLGGLVVANYGAVRGSRGGKGTSRHVVNDSRHFVTPGWVQVFLPLLFSLLCPFFFFYFSFLLHRLPTRGTQRFSHQQFPSFSVWSRSRKKMLLCFSENNARLFAFSQFLTTKARKINKQDDARTVFRSSRLMWYPTILIIPRAINFQYLLVGYARWRNVSNSKSSRP